MTLNGLQIAGVILEPVVGNGGFIPPTKEFLQGLRKLTQEEGALLCFDEVMTGFRIAKVRMHTYPVPSGCACDCG